MFKWRLENKEDYYDVLIKWWDSHNFPHLPYTSVPNRIFVVYTELRNTTSGPLEVIDLYAVPVYRSDSDVCWIGFPTSNKNTHSALKVGALEFLLDKLEVCLKYEGYNTIITTSAIPTLQEKFLRSGFEAKEDKVNYYIKNI